MHFALCDHDEPISRVLVAAAMLAGKNEKREWRIQGIEKKQKPKKLDESYIGRCEDTPSACMGADVKGAG